jgi:hypothetical protein
MTLYCNNSHPITTTINAHTPISQPTDKLATRAEQSDRSISHSNKKNKEETTKTG